jgi:hypothetical protein
MIEPENAFDGVLPPHAIADVTIEFIPKSTDQENP